MMGGMPGGFMGGNAINLLEFVTERVESVRAQLAGEVVPQENAANPFSGRIWSQGPTRQQPMAPPTEMVPPQGMMPQGMMPPTAMMPPGMEAPPAPNFPARAGEFDPQRAPAGMNLQGIREGMPEGMPRWGEGNEAAGSSQWSTTDIALAGAGLAFLLLLSLIFGRMRNQYSV